MTPRPAAAPGELIRRVYLDLVGLVPTPEEVRAFVADPSDRAYEEIVDRLLASPQYGERWGRHWMDVWRYSDWDGFGAEIRESQPHIWRWRDWIVESLNADRGYDQMIVQMLAADEAAPDDPAALRATGFLARNWYKFNRNVWLDATIEHTAKAFLGLTINCARCHDHKYDPIAQTEYYRFRAFFEPHTTRTDRVPGQPDTQKDGLVRVYDGEPQAKTFLFTRGDEKRPVQDRPLDPGIPQVLERQVPLPPITPVALRPTAYYPALNAWIQEEALAQARADLKARESDLARAEKARGAATRCRRGDQGARTIASWQGKPLEAARSGLVVDRPAGSPPIGPGSHTGSRRCRALARAAAKAERVAEVHRAELALLQAELALADAERAAQAPKAKDDRGSPQGPGRRQGQTRRSPGRAEDQTAGRRAGEFELLSPECRLPGDQHGPPPGPGTVDHRPQEPAHRPGGHQSSLDEAFRRVPGPDRVRLRRQRQASHPPGAPRLAGRRADGLRLEDEAHPPPDRHQQRLSDAVARAVVPAIPTWRSTR